VIDVFVTSSSRPQLLERTLKSFLAGALYLGNFRFYINEDYVDSHESSKCLNVLNSILNGYSLKCNSPPIGLSGAFLHFSRYFENEFLFYLQDDWELIRPIDLGRAITLFRACPFVNQVRFNKRKTMKYKGEGDTKWCKKELICNGYTITTSDSWYLNPSLWRTSFIAPFISSDLRGKPSQRPYIWKLNEILGKHFKVVKHQGKYDGTDFSDKVGTYIYGGIDSPPFFKHLGGTQRRQFESRVW